MNFHASLLCCCSLHLQPVLDMGRNIRTTVKPARKKASAAGAAASGTGAAVSQTGANRALAKPVVNCLGCGKVYDCRAPSEEARRFLGACHSCCRESEGVVACSWGCGTLPAAAAFTWPVGIHRRHAESGGLCSFCGRRVALRYADGGTNQSAADAPPVPEPPSRALTGGEGGELAGFKPESQQGNAAASVAYNDSAAAAAALRDRLVRYDRESARRTTVLDDQEDHYAFLDIDANPWLTGGWGGPGGGGP